MSSERTVRVTEEARLEATDSAYCHPMAASFHSENDALTEGALDITGAHNVANKSQDRIMDSPRDPSNDIDGSSTESDSELERDLISDIKGAGWMKQHDLNPSARLVARTKQARRKLLQTNSYTTLLEDRLSYLEDAIRQILKQPERPEFDDESTQLLENKIEFEELNCTEFYPTIDLPPASTRGWKHRPELKVSKKPIIQILMEDPSFSTPTLGGAGRRIWDRFSTYDGSDPGTDSNPTLQRHMRSGGAPYRIRIQSRILLKLLKHITGLDTSTGPHNHRTLFVQPFKFLIKYADKIEQYIHKNQDHLGE